MLLDISTRYFLNLDQAYDPVLVQIAFAHCCLIFFIKMNTFSNVMIYVIGSFQEVLQIVVDEVVDQEERKAGR